VSAAECEFAVQDIAIDQRCDESYRVGYQVMHCEKSCQKSVHPDIDKRTYNSNETEFYELFFHL